MRADEHAGVVPPGSIELKFVLAHPTIMLRDAIQESVMLVSLACMFAGNILIRLNFFLGGFECGDAMRFVEGVPEWHENSTQQVVGSTWSAGREVAPWVATAGRPRQEVQQARQ